MFAFPRTKKEITKKKEKEKKKLQGMLKDRGKNLKRQSKQQNHSCKAEIWEILD
jgi:hypothetical protein